ncbi:PP2C family protein-serine/threonine phosphatase [Actinophytocola glycyrrhizae]|uniref:PP2C family protein-serine/threonine phosphatase n=1 Tax=Actinophytocola glycyrrhizae TaxID=2044873 RepID=A0ABV9S4N4_9PSEU
MTTDGEFDALLDDSAEDLYEHAPCGYLSTTLDGRIVKVNKTLLDWLGRTPAEVLGRSRFTDLLTVGGRMYHETHFAPLLRLQGSISGIALELRTASGEQLPVLVTSVVKTDSAGEPLLVRTTVFDARDRRAYERELLRARRAAEQEQARATELARTLQRTLLPPVLPAVPGLSVAAHYHPASADQVGGDFYDLFPLPGDRWGVFVGDVCGKGAPAAAFTSLTRYTLRSAAVFDDDPVAVLRNLNTVLHQERSDRQFCTVMFGVLTLSPRSHCTVTLASGGHLPALLLGADGSTSYHDTPGGQLLGLLPSAHIATTVVRMAKGDTLLLYTDGLTEARVDDSRNRLGEEALLDFARAHAPTTAEKLVKDLRTLLSTLRVDDDVAALSLST